ncbi:uncharacterized protein LOC117242055 [Bombus vosnesenskii]|uniref:Uncharacterized protein LOC117242055 n=1 Tax=Bombus vosnesenskii TaxID=207650 RepID=A0A6J3LFZ6_9HYME|nr:uncharacterized protein LOC117154999 [Bombus vancouverensis nearcticus]XP_033364297.1 uncharacterized protein LOC117242055 [Bombus vosnesenskii]
MSGKKPTSESFFPLTFKVNCADSTVETVEMSIRKLSALWTRAEKQINVVRGRAATSSTARRTTVDERILGVSYRASRRASLRRGIGAGEQSAERGCRRRDAARG